MVYIYYDNYLIIETIAHEFCHLIWFNYEFDEVHFILEGMAEYATCYAGYLSSNGNISRRTDYFLDTPDDSLIYFDVAQKDYGGSYLFSFYLAERFGVQFLTDLVQQDEDGALGIETALQQAGHNISFNELYLDWVTALTVDETGFAEDRYGFQDIDVQFQQMTIRDDLPVRIEAQSIRYYGCEIIKINQPSDNFTVSVSEPGSGVVGVSIAYHDAEGWHVHKKIQNRTICENVTGNSIDTVYIITSLMFTEASGGAIDFGEGFSGEVDLVITEYSPTSTPSNGAETTQLYIGLSISFVSVLIVAILYMYRSKQTT
jgi:hypothetical protein